MADLFQMKIGEKIRWYVMNIGSEVDLHTPHWHA
jgi:manganese oxidase